MNLCQQYYMLIIIKNVFAKSTKMTKKLYNEKYLNILLH